VVVKGWALPRTKSRRCEICIPETTMRSRRSREPTAKHPPQLRASDISDAYGFTSRRWIRQAAAGRIPGARQPSGVGGVWLFDARLFAKLVGYAHSDGRGMAGLYRRGESKIWWGRAQRQGREYRRSLKTADRALAERRFRQWLTDLDAIAWGEKPRRSFEERAKSRLCQRTADGARFGAWPPSGSIVAECDEPKCAGISL